MDFWLFVGFIVLLVWCKKLSNRIAMLEDVLEHGTKKAQPIQSVVSTGQVAVPTADVASHATEVMTNIPLAPSRPMSMHDPASYVPRPVVSAAIQRADTVPPEPSPLMEWLKENTMIKIGAFLFFLGAVWFVSYAIAEGWISPLMRILAGLCVAVLICAVGHWRKQTSVPNYLVLTALGVGISMATIYADQSLFQNFPAWLALLLLTGSIAYAVYVSVLVRTEWLSVLAAAAGCLAPFMVHTPSQDPAMLFTYLLVLAAAFLSIVFVTHWRTVTLALVVGVSLLTFTTYAAMPQRADVFLLFVPIFMLLFFTASSVSMFRSNTPWNKDVLALSITSTMAVWWAHTFLPAVDGLVVFVFALACAGVGYLFFLEQKSQRLVSVYAGFASVLILIATSLTFDGFALTLMYTCEITLAIILAMHLRFTDRLIRLTAWTFALPVLLSFTDMAAPAWQNSVLHPSALTLYALAVATFVVSRVAFLYHKERGSVLLQYIATSFFVLCWFYAYTCVALFCTALFDGYEATLAAQCILWASVSVLFVTRVLSAKLSRSLFIFTFSTFIIPVFASLAILDVPVTSWLSPTLLVLYCMGIISLGLLSALYLVGRARGEDVLVMAAEISLGASWFYGIATIAFMAVVFASSDFATVFKYLGWTAVTLSLFSVLLALRAPLRWGTVVLWTLLLPIFASLPSLVAYQWHTSLLHVHALGLFTFTAVLLYAAAVLWQLSRLAEGPQSDTLIAYAQKVGITGVVYAAALVWVVADALLTSEDVAVSVALFVYTVCGLALYTFGRTHGSLVVRKVGIGVLVLVVMRLLIIDVWNMEILGRIATFLGVGLLFIVTALFEKPFRKEGE